MYDEEAAVGQRDEATADAERHAQAAFHVGLFAQAGGRLPGAPGVDPPHGMRGARRTDARSHGPARASRFGLRRRRQGAEQHRHE
jgi:hypothetical protein